MVLHAKNRALEVPKASHSAVVEVSVGDFAARSEQTFFVNAKPVILAGDLDSAALEVANGLIYAAMAELQLPGRGTQRER